MTPDTILHGDCTNVMRRIADRSVDFVLTDPPYLCNYRSRDGETVRNDRRGDWIYPSFRHIHRGPETGQLLRQLLRLAQGGRIHRSLAQGGLPAGGTYRLSEALCLIVPVPAEHARTGLSAGQGRAGHAGTPDPGRAGLAVHR